MKKKMKKKITKKKTIYLWKKKVATKKPSVTISQLREILHEAVDRRGIAKVQQIMMSVASKKSLSQVPAIKYQALVEAIEGLK